MKGDEGKRQEALAVVQSLQQQIAVVDRDIKFLEEEQSKVEAMHIEFKLKEIERQKEAVQKELEPYRKAYEDAKTAFKKAEIVSSIVRNFPSGSHRTKLHYAWLRYAEESLS